MSDRPSNSTAEPAVPSPASCDTRRPEARSSTCTQALAPGKDRLAYVSDVGLVVEIPLDPEAGRRIGVLAAAAGSRDVVDGHVAIIALDRDAVVLTSDLDVIARWGVPDENIVRC
jgi:hypothetical protein